MNQSNQFFCHLGRALKNKEKTVIFPFSPIGWSILNICLKENYLYNLQKKDNQIIAFFAHNSHTLLIKTIKRSSLSSCRNYLSFSSILKMNNNFSQLFILSTPLGILSHHHAIQHRLGGELLCVFDIQ